MWTASIAVIIALLVTDKTFLSVNAIICHQCNSHNDEGCIRLRQNTPRGAIDDQFLRECEGPTSSIAFCRKTVLTIEATREHRVVRSCGWLKGDVDARNVSCFNADNEGYLQTICTCFEDGCNGARATPSPSSLLVLLISVITMLASFLRSFLPHT